MRVFRQSARRLSSAAKSPRDAVIVGVARTPVGGFNGSLAALKAPELGSAAISAALDRAGVPKESVEQCWMGNVIASGMGQAPARQAAQMAGLPDSTCCTTVNKVCSSGMKAVTLGSQEIVLGNADVLVAGGMESMSNVPYYLPKARFGARMGDATMVDGLVFDGLWDPYDNCHMGAAAHAPARLRPVRTPRASLHARRDRHDVALLRPRLLRPRPPCLVLTCFATPPLPLPPPPPLLHRPPRRLLRRPPQRLLRLLVPVRQWWEPAAWVRATGAGTSREVQAMRGALGPARTALRPIPPAPRFANALIYI